jgi:hypothetical protein
MTRGPKPVDENSALLWLPLRKTGIDYFFNRIAPKISGIACLQELSIVSCEVMLGNKNEHDDETVEERRNMNTNGVRPFAARLARYHIYPTARYAAGHYLCTTR